MAKPNRIYMPDEIKNAYEFAAKATNRDMRAVQEIAIREYLKKERIKYHFVYTRKKRGPKPKVSISD